MSNESALTTVHTWEDVLDVPGEQPVKGGVEQHHDDGDDEGVPLALLRALEDVGPLDPDALLLVLRKVLAAVPERHAGQQTLEE